MFNIQSNLDDFLDKHSISISSTLNIHDRYVKYKVRYGNKHFLNVAENYFLKL